MNQLVNEATNLLDGEVVAWEYFHFDSAFARWMNATVVAEVPDPDEQ
ncbi:MAG: hypothetical protein ABGZ35_23160 [Planctomycetaceae bacterium]